MGPGWGRRLCFLAAHSRQALDEKDGRSAAEYHGGQALKHIQRICGTVSVGGENKGQNQRDQGQPPCQP